MDSTQTAREQIAVFGESGSGKTVLLSSFYGAAQEQNLDSHSLFDLIADDTAQGIRLHQNYLGMKNAATAPMTTRFTATEYAFTIKRRHGAVAKAKRSRGPSSVQLIWHDYPGDWFEEEPANVEERQRRVVTFQSLLGSDVALLLVDGQRLVEHAGEEERYLKSLLANYTTHLSRLRDELLPDGKPLVRFPRIWLFALSKADLLPDADVVWFRDLLIQKVGSEIARLQMELKSFVDAPEAFSLGEDFVLLSSAKFEPGRIEVSQQIGVKLIIPIAAVLPFTRHVRWAQSLEKGSKVAKELLATSLPYLAFVATKLKIRGPIGVVIGTIIAGLVDVISGLTTERVEELHNEARAKHDFLTTVLTGFRLELDEGVEQKVLLRSAR